MEAMQREDMRLESNSYRPIGFDFAIRLWPNLYRAWYKRKAVPDANT